MATEKYTNDALSTLNGAINNSTTTVVVTSASTFPTTGNFRVMVDSEIMLVTAVSSNTFTVTRGQEGTTGASHSDLAPIAHIMTKGALDAIFADNWQAGTMANLPAAERAGRIYQATDYPGHYRDTGSAWQPYFRGFPVTYPVAASYAWTHGGSTATDTQITNGPVLLQVGSVSATDKISKFVKAIATPPYTYTYRFLTHLYDFGSYGGPCWSDGTKVITTGVIIVGNAVRFWVAKWTNLTTFSADYITRLYLSMNAGDLWVRLKDDNSNRIVQYSIDGVNYFNVHSVGRTDFMTATDVGMFIGCNPTAGTAKLTWLSDS